MTNIFSKENVGKLVVCKLEHVDTKEEYVGRVRWTHAYVNTVVDRATFMDSEKGTPGPWKILEIL